MGTKENNKMYFVTGTKNNLTLRHTEIMSPPIGTAPWAKVSSQEIEALQKISEYPYCIMDFWIDENNEFQSDYKTAEEIYDILTQKGLSELEMKLSSKKRRLELKQKELKQDILFNSAVGFDIEELKTKYISGQTELESLTNEFEKIETLKKQFEKDKKKILRSCERGVKKFHEESSKESDSPSNYRDMHEWWQMDQRSFLRINIIREYIEDTVTKIL